MRFELLFGLVNPEDRREALKIWSCFNENKSVKKKI